MSKHIFTYGALMFADVWQNLTSHNFAHSTIATMAGVRRGMMLGKAYPGAIQSHVPGHSIEGRLYLNVDENDLNVLDDFEGQEYFRKTLRARCSNTNVEFLCDIYLLQPRYQHQLLPHDWSVESFVPFIPEFIADRQRENSASPCAQSEQTISEDNDISVVDNAAD